MMKCPECKKVWPENCEQAIAIELYGSCCYCKRFDSDLDFKKIKEVQKERGYIPPPPKEESE